MVVQTKEERFESALTKLRTTQLGKAAAELMSNVDRVWDSRARYAIYLSGQRATIKAGEMTPAIVLALELVLESFVAEAAKREPLSAIRMTRGAYVSAQMARELAAYWRQLLVARELLCQPLTDEELFLLLSHSSVQSYFKVTLSLPTWSNPNEAQLERERQRPVSSVESFRAAWLEEHKLRVPSDEKRHGDSWDRQQSAAKQLQAPVAQPIVSAVPTKPDAALVFPHSLPCRLRIVETDFGNRLGKANTADGVKVTFGFSSCKGFTPAVGGECYLLEVATLAGQWRARVLSESTAAPKDAATLILERKQEEAAAKAKRGALHGPLEGQTVRSILARIDAWLSQHAPQSQPSAKATINQADMDELRAAMVTPLPNELVELLCVPSGLQRLGFWEFLTPEEMRAEWESMRELAQEEADADHDLVGSDEVQMTFWNDAWVPFLMLGGASDYHCVDMAPSPSGQKGQVIEVTKDGMRQLIATNLISYMDQLARGLEGGWARVENGSVVFDSDFDVSPVRGR